MSEIKRKRTESFEAFMRRVKQQWQRSGRILQARKIQYFAPKKSKNQQHKEALHRVQVTTKINYLRKTGKLPKEESFKR